MDRNAMTKEIRERIVLGGGIGHIREDEIDAVVLEAEAAVTEGAVKWMREQRAGWRPIAEAPIPPPDGLPVYWIYRCLIQDTDRNVMAGFVRYIDQTSRGRSPRVLRWYEGVSQRYAIIPNPKYFMPLPVARED